MRYSGYSFIGDIPCSWDISKVKAHFIRKNEKAHLENPVILSLARTGVKERDISNNEGQLAESYYNYNPVSPGDLLINPMDLYSGANCSISNVSGVISPAYFNLRALDNTDPGYYDYYFKTQYWSMAFFAHGRGVSFENRWTLNSETLMNYPIPVPSYSEQIIISRYLREKTLDIDRAIALVQSNIEDYLFLKTAVISDYVFGKKEKGVNFIDSGHPWVGAIPDSYECTILKKVIKEIESGVSVNAGQEPAGEGEIGVLKTSSVSKNVFIPKENKSINEDEYGRVACPVTQNTLIVSRMNTPELVGACAYVDKDYPNLFLPDRLWKVHIKQDYNTKYIWYYLSTAFVRNYYSSLSSGTSSSMQNISQGQFQHVPLFIPPVEKQNEIVALLDQIVPKIDQLIEAEEHYINDLETYRRSVVFEVVTGKRKVG